MAVTGAPLKDYQVRPCEDLVAALRRHRGVLDASSTGFGKTYVALHAARKLGLRPFVVCPKSAIHGWKEASDATGVPLSAITNYEKIRTGRTEYGRWTRKNQVFSLSPPRGSLVVFDEVHRCKTRTSQNCKVLLAVKSLNPDLYRTLMISATCAVDPLEMFGTGQVLGLHGGGSDFMWWCRAHGVKRGTFGLVFKGGTAAMNRIHESIFPEKGVRVISSRIPGFPSRNLVMRAIDPSDDLSAKEVQSKLDALADKRAGDEDIPLVDRLRARQELELLKVKYIADTAKELVREGNSVPVFVHFKETIHELVGQIGEHRCAVLHGDMDSEARANALDAFQSNKLPVIVAQIATGSESINLHDLYGRPRVSLVCPTDSAVQFVQALGRTWRTGSLSPATQILLFTAGTVEERIKGNVERKKDNLDALNDGDMSLGQGGPAL